LRVVFSAEPLAGAVGRSSRVNWLRPGPWAAYGRLMTYEWWPLFDLRLAGPRLTLRPMREADLDLLAGQLPEDLELDPAATRFDPVGERVKRGIITHQGYWRAYGNWRPQAWRLNFVVSLGPGPGGPVIGVQELEGLDNFLVLRTVDSSSYLSKPARGQGYGKEMRRSVLALAFGPLQAQAAITAAWHDNGASLGVSRALGYRPNGEWLQERELPEASQAVAGAAEAGAADAGLAEAGAEAEPRADVMVHLRMRREDWLASGQGADVEIKGFDACRPLFGLPPT
jgi:RimJ/RimL family protein N-acetyltransferase